MSEDGFVYEETKENEAGVKNPRYAWLAPIGGIGAALFCGILLNVAGVGKGQSEFRSMQLIIGMLPGVMLIGMVIYGIVKTVQCFIGKRHVGHGIAGAIVCSGMILLFIATFGALNQARQTARAYAESQQLENASAEVILREFCKEVKPTLPVQVDSSTLLVGLEQVSPEVVQMKYLITDPTISKLMMQEMKGIVESDMKSQSLYKMLVGKGATLSYVYEDTDGNVMTSFEIKP